MVVAFCGLLACSVVLVPLMFITWWHDKHSPIYMAPRVARGGGVFRMVKLRSMVINADRLGASSTSNADVRITPIGRVIRRYKLDEATQLWNVLWGDMSLVGPRPQVPAGVAPYTIRERELLSVRPGITDFASIVFADEGAILETSADPDADYDSLIRPWKSRLGLIYIARRSLMLDVRLVIATIVAIVSRPHALRMVEKMLTRLGAPAEVISMARRQDAPVPALPPGDDFAIDP